MLFQKKVNVNIIDINNKILLWIVYKQYKDSYQSKLTLMLIFLNIKTNIKITNYWKISLLRLICTKFFLNVKKWINVVRLLLKNTILKHLSTIRHILINVSFLVDFITRLLISYNTLVNATNKKRKTTLYYIARSWNYKTFRALLVYDANKRIRN